MSENAFVTALTEVKAVRSVTDVGVKKLNKCWKEDVLLPESIGKSFGAKEVS